MPINNTVNKNAHIEEIYALKNKNAVLKFIQEKTSKIYGSYPEPLCLLKDAHEDPEYTEATQNSQRDLILCTDVKLKDFGNLPRRNIRPTNTENCNSRETHSELKVEFLGKKVQGL